MQIWCNDSTFQGSYTELMIAAAEKASKSILESCLAQVAVSSSLIVAGSGDLDLFKIFRALRTKIDDVSYGTHLALGMAIGNKYSA